jgi:hypothetical protein
VRWASTILRAVVADFFFNCWYLEIPSDNRIRHIPRCVHYHAQGFRLIGNVLEFLCWKWKPYPRLVFCKSRSVWVSFYTREVCCLWRGLTCVWVTNTFWWGWFLVVSLQGNRQTIALQSDLWQDLLYRKTVLHPNAKMPDNSLEGSNDADERFALLLRVPEYSASTPDSGIDLSQPPSWRFEVCQGQSFPYLWYTSSAIETA